MTCLVAVKMTERKVTVVNAMRSPDKKISTVSLTSDRPAKPDLGDIIIAAAAAKVAVATEGAGDDSGVDRG